MNSQVTKTASPKAKNALKTGFRRTLGLIILFATVTLSSCTELIPFLDIFNK